MADTTKSELLRRVRRYLAKRPGYPSDELAAWEEFYDMYSTILVEFARRRVRDRRMRNGQTVENILQEVWGGVLASFPTFEYDRSKGGFRRWLYSIVRRRAASYFADEQEWNNRKELTSVLAKSLADPKAEDPSKALEREFDDELLRLGERKLKADATPMEWRVYKARELRANPKSFAQIAEELDTTEEAARQSFRRAKRKLRRILKDLIGGNDDIWP